jgi:predicted RNA-binding Zn ribbon-like protein
VGTASQPAPGRLETVRAFVNTRDVESAVDALATPADLARWLHEVGLSSSVVPATSSDLQHALAVREALRAALTANHDRAAVPSPALEVLSEAAERAEPALRLDADAVWVAEPRAAGAAGALGALLSIVAGAMADGTWRRLKVCVNDACQWAFYDLSRARSGKWCSMQICGNRAKQQAWRARSEESQRAASGQ